MSNGLIDLSGSLKGITARNYIINGGFDFWNRNALWGGGVQQGSSNGLYAYCDRWYWKAVCDGINWYMPNITNVTEGSTNAAKVYASIVSPHESGLFMGQIIENSMCQPLSGKTVSISLSIKKASTGVLPGVIDIFKIYYVKNNLKADISSGTLVVSTPFNALSDTTYTRVSGSFTFPSIDNMTDTVSINLSMGYGGSQVNYIPLNQGMIIKDVMLNEGPVAAPFSRAGGTYAGEQQLCMRYWEFSDGLSTATVPHINMFMVNQMVMIPFIVRKRAIPVIYTSSDYCILVSTQGAMPYTITGILTKTDGSYSRVGRDFFHLTMPGWNGAGTTNHFGWAADADL